MGLRELKKRNTRLALSDAALTLGIEHGFDVITVDDIAAAALVSRRTFHRYFETKEAAFFWHQEERLARFRAALADRRPGESAYQVVRRSLLDFAEEYDENRIFMTRRYQAILGSRALLAHDLGIDQKYEDAIAEALATDVDARQAAILAAALFGVVRAVLREWFADPEAPPLPNLGRAALAWLEAGVGDPGPAGPLLLEAPR